MRSATTSWMKQSIFIARPSRSIPTIRMLSTAWGWLFSIAAVWTKRSTPQRDSSRSTRKTFLPTPAFRCSIRLRDGLKRRKRKGMWRRYWGGSRSCGRPDRRIGGQTGEFPFFLHFRKREFTRLTTSDPVLHLSLFDFPMTRCETPLLALWSNGVHVPCHG